MGKDASRSGAVIALGIVAGTGRVPETEKRTIATVGSTAEIGCLFVKASAGTELETEKARQMCRSSGQGYARAQTHQSLGRDVQG